MHIEDGYVKTEAGIEYAAMNKGISEVFPKARESRKHHSLERLKGAWCCQHLDFYFWPP